MEKRKCTKKIISVLIAFVLMFSIMPFTTIKAKAAAGTIDDFVERCYTVTLDRGSDPDGFADWKGQLLNGKAVGIEVAYGFLFSPEYTRKNKSNEDYVKDLYMLFMGREPDEGGFNDWVGQLNDGKTRLEVFAGFANSQEFYNICESYGITAGRYVAGYDRKTINNVNLFVERMYKITLGRIGDRDGQKNWVEKLITKQISGSECARSFIFSQEYMNKGLSDEEFVENLYLAMFGRPSDADGKYNWLFGLKNGMTRDEVFEGFANSIEFDNICKAYGINRGTYTATNKGAFDKDNPYNVPADPTTEHKHSFNQENIAPQYLLSDASCVSPAIYFKSCTCGEMDMSNTFTFGEPLGHDWDEGTLYQLQTTISEGKMEYHCKRCGEYKIEPIPKEEHVHYFDQLKKAKVGDTVIFGATEQDGIWENGQEELEWQVLAKENGDLVVISKYVLTVSPVVEDSDDYLATWESSCVRSYLNDEFYKYSFDDKEKKLIPSIKNKNMKNPINNTNGGKDTVDKVFCLSVDELIQYFKLDVTDTSSFKSQKIMAEPTKEAIRRYVFRRRMTSDIYYEKYADVYTSDIIDFLGAAWWLRTSSAGWDGQKGTGTCFVYYDGVAGYKESTYNITEIIGVRPVIHIRIQ